MCLNIRQNQSDCRLDIVLQSGNWRQHTDTHKVQLAWTLTWKDLSAPVFSSVEHLADSTTAATSTVPEQEHGMPGDASAVSGRQLYIDTVVSGRQLYINTVVSGRQLYVNTVVSGR